MSPRTSFALDHVRKPRRGTVRGEKDFHIGLVCDLRRILTPGTVMFHCPNGGMRHPREAAILKAMGTMAGVPDLIFIRDGRAYGLELKTENGSLSLDQRHAHVEFRAAGMRIEVARNLDEALRHLREMGIPLRIKDETATQVFRRNAA